MGANGRRDLETCPTAPRLAGVRRNLRPLAGLAMLTLAPLAGLAAGCSDSGGGPALPSFHDIGTASGSIQLAAQAVVRVYTAGSYGTGAFISSSGLLITNNHVLGAPVCPIEGCTIQLTFQHQRGQPSQSPMTVFAVPQAVDVGLDMAVVQIFQGEGAETLATPSFLTLASHDSASLLGQHITIVGHPEGELKKWTDGVVVDAFGAWFSSSAYILPGDSGSPMLDDLGNMVGIIHRGPTSQSLITSNGVDEYSIGTASASLQAALNAPLPAVMISTAAAATASDVVANDVVYLNARTPDAIISGAPTSVLSLLGAACDAALARTDFASPDDLSSAMAPCNAGQQWIECRYDESVAYGAVCPAGADASAWAARFQMMNQLQVAMNGNTNLYPVSFGIAALASDRSAGLVAGGQSLQQALVAANQVLDFGVENYLAAFDVSSYAGNDTLAWLRAYPQRPDYALYAESIASAFLWFMDNGVLGQDEAFAALAKLDSDPDVDIGAKLYIEDVQYLRGP